MSNARATTPISLASTSDDRLTAVQGNPGLLRSLRALGAIRSFHDLPLWAKTLLAPAACVIAGVAVVMSIWLGATATEAGLADVANRALPTASASADLLDEIDRVHVLAMRALVWQQAGVPQATIDRLGGDISHDLDRLRATTAALATGRSDADADRPRLVKIAAQSISYAKMLGDALDLINDPAIAVGYFRRADAAFDALRGDIAGMATAHRAAEAASIQAARDGTHAALLRSYWLFGVSTAIMLILLPVVVAMISRPVRALTRVMNDLAAGNMDADISARTHRDEIGDMARAVLVFKDHMVRGQLLAAEQEQIRQRAEMEKRAALVGMAEKVEAETETALRQVALRTSALAATAEALSLSASRTGSSAQDATEAANQALGNVQTVASGAEELAASIREINRQVSQSTAVAGRAVAAGAATRATIDGLNKEVERIGAVADLIAEIAARTNLLALNATIEAARAGAAGKGFAVVAAEVKALAKQTAGSTQEIARHISQVRSATAGSATAVALIEQTIAELDGIAGAIAASVQQQGAATEEIARTISQTATMATAMSARTGEVSTEADETGRQAVEVRDNAIGLDAEMNALRRAVIRVVRSATSEVDRRFNERFAIDLACLVTVGDRSHAARIADLSETGARVLGVPPVTVGSSGVLAIDGVAMSLPFSVKHSNGEVLNVEFELAAAAAAEFAGTPARLAQRRAA